MFKVKSLPWNGLSQAHIQIHFNWTVQCSCTVPLDGQFHKLSLGSHDLPWLQDCYALVCQKQEAGHPTKLSFCLLFVVCVQVEKIVLFLIEKQGKLAVRLQRLRKQREDVVREMLEAEESGMDEPPPSPAYVPWRMMDEYR